MARTTTFFAAGAVALAAAGAALAAPQRTPALERQATPFAQVAQAAKKQPVTLGFYEGKTVRYFDFGPIKLTCRTKLGTFLPTEMALLALDSGGRVYIFALVHDRSDHRERDADG